VDDEWEEPRAMIAIRLLLRCGLTGDALAAAHSLIEGGIEP
jgi:hypothetical protein